MIDKVTVCKAVYRQFEKQLVSQLVRQFVQA